MKYNNNQILKNNEFKKLNYGPKKLKAKKVI